MSIENPKQHPLVEADKEIREIEERRTQYEKSTSDIAKDQNSFVENITGRGVDKNDIMQSDARFENELRDNESKRAELASKSDLFIEEIKRDSDANPEILRILKGTINGKAVEIKFLSSKHGNTPRGTPLLDGEN